MAKNNEKIWRWLRMILLIGGVLVAIAVAYGALNNQVQSLTETTKQHKTKLEQHDRDIAVVKTDVKYIRAAVDRIEKKME